MSDKEQPQYFMGSRARRIVLPSERQLRKIERVRAAPEFAKGTRLELVEINKEVVAAWNIPEFQRGVTVNSKVKAVAQKIADDNVVPGILTVGMFEGKLWRVDGQHRLRAFELSGAESAYADVRFMEFETLGAMAQEFHRLNTALVRMRPDDNMRPLETMHPNLGLVRQHCPFVGYDKIRRELTTAPMLSMAAVLRCGFSAAPETPSNGGLPPTELAEQLTDSEADYLIEFLNNAFECWGRDESFANLWKKLNMTLCMWLFRTSVANRGFRPQATKVDRQTWKECLRALRQEPDYLDWLRARTLGDKNRGPAYNKIKTIMLKAARAKGVRITLPNPPWA